MFVSGYPSMNWEIQLMLKPDSAKNQGLVPSVQLQSSQPMLHTTPPPIFYIGNVPHTSPNRRQPPGFRSGEHGSFGWRPSSKRSLEKKIVNLLVVPKNHSISTDGPKKSPAFLEHTLFGVRSKRSSMRRATLQPTYSSHSPLSTSTVS